jgi:hypothetical protein
MSMAAAFAAHRLEYAAGHETAFQAAKIALY